MYSKNYIILVWFASLGVIAFMCLEQGALWGSIIAGSATVLTAIALLVRWICRCIRRKMLFDVYPSDLKQQSFNIIASDVTQKIKITLRMKSSTTLQFIVISFTGNGVAPELKGIYNHLLNEKFDEDDLKVKNYPPNTEFPNGGLNLTLKGNRYRNKGQRIRIGIELVASKPFNGELVVFLATDDDAKKHRLE
jgi:hypothetical protein